MTLTMKKICVFTLFLLALFASCTHETKDIFDKPAAERINEALEEYLDVLTSAPNGWLLYYYPERSQSYGGYNILFDFSRDGSVTVASEVAGPGQTETSLYELISSKGPALTFNTYNSILHYFSTPATSEGGSTGYGFEGDYEFVFMDVTSKEITLQGIKTGNTMKMVALDASVDWDDYLEEVLQMEEEVDNCLYGFYDLTINGSVATTMTMLGNYPVFTYLPTDAENEFATVNTAYVYTESGISFYEPLEIDGVTVQEFIWNNDELIFTAKDNSSVQLVGGYPEGFKHYDDYLGAWKFFAKVARDEIYTEFNVTMSVKQRNSSYTFSGLPWPFSINYNRADSGMSITMGQVLQEDYPFNNGLWPIVLYSSSGPGSLYANSIAGIKITRDDDNDNLYWWVDNGEVGAVTGFGMYIVHTSYTSFANTTFYDCYMIKQ